MPKHVGQFTLNKYQIVHLLEYILLNKVLLFRLLPRKVPLLPENNAQHTPVIVRRYARM
jgi:hypothetical protein